VNNIFFSIPPNYGIQYNLNDFSNNDNRIIKLEVKTNCVKVFVNGVKIGDTCSKFNGLLRLTFKIRYWLSEKKLNAQLITDSFEGENLKTHELIS
jgi:hypothetical protein